MKKVKEGIEINGIFRIREKGGVLHKKIKRICEYCQKEFLAYLNSPGRFCSYYCRGKVCSANGKNIHKNQLPPFKGSKALKQKAHNYINDLVKSKRITRPNICSCCGTFCTPVFHHPDYEKLNQGQWLCQSCHRKVHYGHKIVAPLVIYNF